MMKISQEERETIKDKGQTTLEMNKNKLKSILQKGKKEKRKKGRKKNQKRRTREKPERNPSALMFFIFFFQLVAMVEGSAHEYSINCASSV